MFLDLFVAPLQSAQLLKLSASARMAAEQEEELIELRPARFHEYTQPIPAEMGLAPETECAVSCFKLRTSLLTWLTQLGVLILFHVLNIAVAVGGVVLATMMLTNVALALRWIVVVAYWRPYFRLLAWIMTISERTYIRALLVFLLVASWTWLSVTNTYTYVLMVVIPLLSWWMEVADIVVHYVSCAISYLLVVSDVKLSQFVDFALPIDVNPLNCKECAGHFKFPVRSVRYECEEPLFQAPRITLTRRIWSLVFYFAVPKIIVGVMSAVALVLVLVQPVTAACTRGNDPFIGSWIDSQLNPVVYVVAVISLWVLGIIGLKAVGILSTQLTVRVCGPW